MHEHETNLRSVVKSITWRSLATATTIVLVFIFFHRIDLAIIIGGIEMLLKLILYFAHERIWSRVYWGKVMIGSE